MRRTTMYLPEDPDSLIAETHQAVIVDSRIVSVAAGRGPDPGRPYDPDSETEVQFASRRWRSLIPTQNAGDSLRMRLKYGWTAEEVREIRRLILQCSRELSDQAQHVLLSGTAETLRRDSHKLELLGQRWARME